MCTCHVALHHMGAESTMRAESTMINWRASEASETPSIATYRKKCVYSTYVKTTMRMLTILREAEEWTRVHLREACLLFASAITKSSLYIRQNDKAHAHQITLLSLSP